jgi:CubicO group peptidase (beta-lactamase class C family)
MRRTANGLILLSVLSVFLMSLKAQVSPLRLKLLPVFNPVRTQQSPSQTSYAWPESSPEDQGLDSEIFQKAVAHANYLGFTDSLLVVRNGALIAEEYFNGYTRESPHLIASASKTFIGALAGIAVRDSMFTLDQKLLEFYPEYVTPRMDPRKQQITLRHMLQMLTGFWDIDTMQSSNRIRYAVEYLPLYDDPGNSWRYSTIPVHLMSGIITRMSGMSTLEYANLHLFGPLGISVAAWSQDPAGIYTGGFGMSFTPRDLARFGELFIQNGNLDGLQIIPQDYLQESWVPSEPSLGALWYDAIEESGYGYLWWVAKMGGYWTYLARGHGGQHVVVVPELDMVIVLTGKIVTTSYLHHPAHFRLSAYMILTPIRDWLGEPPFAPENARGSKQANHALLQTGYVNRVVWEPSSRNQGLDIAAYRVYLYHSASDRELLLETSAIPFEFQQAGREVTETSEHVYGITAVTGDQKESLPAFVILYRPEGGRR